MFEPDSRYFNLPEEEWQAPDGRIIKYKQRRFIPPADAIPSVSQVTVSPGDRLDIIANQTLGNAELFWRLSDANNIVNPFDVAGSAGRILRIPLI